MSGVALACFRSALRGSWRQMTVLALLTGILGAVTLGALAGARRTDTAYGRYLAAINVSDVFVNVPGVLPGFGETDLVARISALPGVVAHATYIGLNGYPVVHGKVDDSFLTDSVNGSLDGEYFSQDRATVLAGALPPPGSANTVVLTPSIARMFGTGVGGTVQYQFAPLNGQGQPEGKPFTRSYRVAAIAVIPPALVDQSDDIEGSVLPPGATRQLRSAYYYAWIGLRLADGSAGIPRLQQRLAALADQLEQQVRQETGQNVKGILFGVNRTDVNRSQVRQAIAPEVIALTAFGVIAGAALLVLAGQGLAQLVSRRAPDLRGAQGAGRHPRPGRADRGPARSGLGGRRHRAGGGGRDRPVPAGSGRAGAPVTIPAAGSRPIPWYSAPERPHRRAAARTASGAGDQGGQPAGRLAAGALVGPGRGGRGRGSPADAGDRDPQRARARPLRPGPVGPDRRHRGGHGGGDRGGLQRQPGRAGLPSGPVRLELGHGHRGRVRLRELRARGR